MASPFTERRHARRKIASGDVWWRAPNDDRFQRGWLIERSQRSAAFLTRGSSTPALATRIRICLGLQSDPCEQGEDAFVSRVNRVHADLCMVIAQLNPAIP